MNRDNNLKVIADSIEWDIIIIGGGATGLGAAVDASSRGYKTLLLEQSDFAKGTSSRSTKLIHGGVRYLAQGNIKLVYEALKERGYLLKNAPHVVKKHKFIIPCYSFFSILKYFIGLSLYDWLSGNLSFGKSAYFSRKHLLKLIPEIKSSGLKGGIEYCDGQFDDARLAINLAQTATENGGILLNYISVLNITKDDYGKVNGVIAVDVENKKEYQLRSKVVINATGVFADDILKMDVPETKQLISPSQGVHIVLPKTFLNGADSIMIPKTSDGRVLFIIPWHNHLLVGTTDTPISQSSLEPKALENEIDFILSTCAQYLTKPPDRKDVLSVFAGLRPLAAPQKGTTSTKEISRNHKLMVSDSGLITIIGGKWTTYRKMAEDTINAAIKIGGLLIKNCITKDLKIYGYTKEDSKNYLCIYGTDEENIRALIDKNSHLAKKLIAHLPYTIAEVIWAVKNEMARTVEDVLARRLRILFLDAKAAINVAPQVAAIVASELNYDKSWEDSQINSFVKLANDYLLSPYKTNRLAPSPVND